MRRVETMISKVKDAARLIMTRKVGKYVAILLGALALVVCVVVVYIGQLNRVVSDNMYLSMDEVAQHDVESIEASINVSFERLSSMTNRLIYNDFDEIDQLQKRLGFESETSQTFNEVYLLDEQGRLYSSEAVVDLSSERVYDALFSEGQARMVRLFSTGEDESPDQAASTDQTASIVYSMSIEGLSVEGVRFTAVLGACDISDIRQQMRIESFDGRGYSSIIDDAGSYVVNAGRILGIRDNSTFYDALDGAVFEEGLDIEAIMDNVRQGTSFSASCVMADGETLMLSFAPVGGTDWSFVMAVPKSVFDEQSSTFVAMTMAMLAVVVVVLAVMMGLLYRYMKRSVEANAHAEARAAFLSSMSHEIRTPLNGIIGLNHLMARHLDDRKQLEGYVSKMDDTAHYLLALVNDILDMSKLQADKVELVCEPFSLAELAESLCVMQREGIEARGITFTCEQVVPFPYVIGDEMRLKQVMMNILSNAAKFTPSGGLIEFRVLQDRDIHNGDARVRMVVRDTGCGMTPEFQSRIFDAFAQENAKVDENQKGTGLGMAISYLLVKQMGGTLSLESEVGKGSCFSVELRLPILLPREKTSRAQAACEEAVGEEHSASQVPQAQAEAEAKPLSVLVAEDNELNAEIVTCILREEGMEVSLARNGREALEAFSASEPGSIDVILMDAQMPVMDGYEASRAIRALDRPDAHTVHIFACTASTFKEDQDRAIASGMDDFLAKPIDVAVLLAKLSDNARA